MAGLRLAVSAGAEFGRMVQLAAHAPDIASAAARFSSEMGAGPFYLFEHIALAACRHRGAPSQFDHSSAYGQLGELMIELIHQHDDRPSVVRDMFDRQTEGLHHAAIFVDDIDAAILRATRRGMAIALDATTADGVRFVMADARAECGLMLEFYEPSPLLVNFYGFIRRKSEGWDGADPLRRLQRS
jgi:hypothetical protein